VDWNELAQFLPGTAHIDLSIDLYIWPCKTYRMLSCFESTYRGAAQCIRFESGSRAYLDVQADVWSANDLTCFWLHPWSTHSYSADLFAGS
jgi:hypothetical protein